MRAPVDAAPLLEKLASEKEIDGGIALARFNSNRPNDFLVCVTETNTRAEIDALVEGLNQTSTTKSQRHEEKGFLLRDFEPSWQERRTNHLIEARPARPTPGLVAGWC